MLFDAKSSLGCRQAQKCKMVDFDNIYNRLSRLAFPKRDQNQLKTSVGARFFETKKRGDFFYILGKS